MGQQFSYEERIEYLKQYGVHCMAYSTLQPGMRYCDLPGVGYIAYMQYCGTRFVLGDPICARPDCERLIGHALEDYPDTCFVQIHEAIATILCRQFGHSVTPIGIEISVELDRWDLRGKMKQVLRTARNQAVQQGVSFAELTGREPIDEMRRISSLWLNGRAVRGRQIAFMVRPLSGDVAPLSDVRTVAASLGSRMIGFAIFDPIYSEGRCIGYVPNITRSSQAFRQGLYYALIVTAIEQFKSERVSILSLGLSPLYKLDSASRSSANGRRGSWPVRATLSWLFEHGTGIYNFAGLAFTKERFGGVETPVFLSSPRHHPFGDVLKVFLISKVL